MWDHHFNLNFPDSVIRGVVMVSSEPSIGTQIRTELSGNPLETSCHMGVDP